MPFDSVQDLKQSDLFQRVTSLRRMSDEALRKFVSAFNAVFKRVKRNDGSKDEAEHTAIPIALSAARKARASLDERTLEEASHFFVAHMPRQFTRSKTKGYRVTDQDFGFVQEAPEVASAMVSGNTFDHGHQGEPAGLIHDIHLVEDLPEDVQAGIDPDAPFVYEASYFEDTPESVKELEGVSAEWSTVPMENGKDLAIPDSFVVSEAPLNAEFTGIGRVKPGQASVPEAIVHEADYDEDTIQALQAVASLTQEERANLEDNQFALTLGEGNDKRRLLPLHDEDHVKSAISRLEELDVEDEKKQRAALNVLKAAEENEVDMSDHSEWADAFNVSSIWSQLFEGNDNDNEAGMSSGMSPSKETGGTSLDSIREKLEPEEADLIEGLVEEKETIESRLEEAEAGLEVLQELQAALGDDDGGGDPGTEEVSAAEVQEQVASIKEEMQDLKEDKLEAEFDKFAEDKLAGKVPTEEWAAWKDQFKDDKERAKQLAAGLPETTLGDNGSQSQNVGEEEQAALDEALEQAAQGEA